jgi:transposase InsO family protein
LTDITEHRTAEGKLYLCAIKDVYSNRIVGYSIDSRMKASLAVSALDHAIATRSPAATIVHSDRGSQFRSRKFVHTLSHNGLRGSMGRVGACGDNAVMESFFALLQRTDRRTTLGESAREANSCLRLGDRPAPGPSLLPRRTAKNALYGSRGFEWHCSRLTSLTELRWDG